MPHNEQREEGRRVDGREMVGAMEHDQGVRRLGGKGVALHTTISIPRGEQQMRTNASLK